MNSTRHEESLSLFDHLAELRTRIIYSVLVILIFTFISFQFADLLLEFVKRPINPHLPQGGLIYLAPIDKFMAYIKLAVLAGVIFSCPFWIYQFWMFVSPGLYQKEKKFAFQFVAFGSSLFLMGLSFAYFVVLPTAFSFLMNFGTPTDKPMIAIDSYLSFVIHVSFVFGLVFELPLILTSLALLNLVTSRFLIDKKRFAIVGMATTAALITPPDALSMILMLGPMWLLYEFGIVLVKLVEKRKKANQMSESTKDLQTE